MRAAEYYSMDRYGADSILLWTRLVGRVTMTTLRADQPIARAALGPTADGWSGQLRVVGIPATAAMALDGHLPAGDTVNVLANGGGVPDIRVLVLEVTRAGTASRPYVILVALPAQAPSGVVAAIGTGEVTLVSSETS